MRQRSVIGGMWLASFPQREVCIFIFYFWFLVFGFWFLVFGFCFFVFLFLFCFFFFVSISFCLMTDFFPEKFCDRIHMLNSCATNDAEMAVYLMTEKNVCCSFSFFCAIIWGFKNFNSLPSLRPQVPSNFKLEKVDHRTRQFNVGDTPQDVAIRCLSDKVLEVLKAPISNLTVLFPFLDFLPPPFLPPLLLSPTPFFLFFDLTDNVFLFFFFFFFFFLFQGGGVWETSTGRQRAKI